jgi:hypothetical protein
VFTFLNRIGNLQKVEVAVSATRVTEPGALCDWGEHMEADRRSAMPSALAPNDCSMFSGLTTGAGGFVSLSGAEFSVAFFAKYSGLKGH